MKHSLLAMTASASLLALATHVAAQPIHPATTTADESTLGEIVVTARRKSESLQEVPQVVNAITADTVQKLNLQHFEDIQTVTPGLTLSQGNTGYSSSFSLRGVNFDVTSGAATTIAMYINDAPLQPNLAFISLFDVEQIEVLRGPQGTTRGISAPTGAITLTTHRPNLSEFGGYADVSVSDLHARNVQGALNVPIIKDVLAIRLAGVLDVTDADGVVSIHSGIRPRQVTGTERVSVSFEPNDRFNANVMYQHYDRDLTDFQQVVGPGDGTADHPAITAKDRLAVMRDPNEIHQHTDIVTAKMDSRIFGQHLSYVGSYQRFHLAATFQQDNAAILPIGFVQNQITDHTETTQEIRISSDPAPGRFFDYTVGAFYDWQDNSGPVHLPAALLPGAFGPGSALGATGPVDPSALNLRYQIPLEINVPGTIQETSIFGSVTFHLGDKTELTGGVRHIASITNGSASLQTLPGTILIAPNFDISIPGSTIQNLANRSSNRPNIYNVSLSHHLTRDLMVYANTGTSFRPGPTAIGIQNGENNAVLNSLVFLQPETSRAYEVGLKATFLDDRARINVAVWRQRYHNLIVQEIGVPYISNSGTTAATRTLSQATFTANANEALVGGVDIDSAFQITRNWNIGLQYSYADGHLTGNSPVPCNDSNFDGRPDGGTVTSASQFPPGEFVALCNTHGRVSTSPYWSATLQTEYTRPVTERANGFFRALVTYNPENKQPSFTAAGYALANLYAGIRSADGAWELSLYARNAFENKTVLGRNTNFATINALGQFFGNLNQTTYSFANGITPRREVGVHLHYAFGSR